MAIYEELLEKWHLYRDHRYKVLVIIKAPLDTLFPTSMIEEFAAIANARVVNFQEKYKGRLNEFFIWQDLRNEMYEMANKQSTVATDLEPIYTKWPVDERLAFLKNILQSEPKYPLVLLLNCQEELSSLQEIEENSRGLIWAPSKW